MLSVVKVREGINASDPGWYTNPSGEWTGEILDFAKATDAKTKITPQPATMKTDMKHYDKG